MPRAAIRDFDCPCGSSRPYSDCCGPFVEAAATPATAEALMRSRYTAYSLGRGDYLRDTWHPVTRCEDLGLDMPISWQGLTVVRASGGGLSDSEGFVEFIARFKVEGRADRIHEISRFVRRKGRWLYVDGEVPQSLPK